MLHTGMSVCARATRSNQFFLFRSIEHISLWRLSLCTALIVRLFTDRLTLTSLEIRIEMTRMETRCFCSICMSSIDKCVRHGMMRDRNHYFHSGNDRQFERRFNSSVACFNRSSIFFFVCVLCVVHSIFFPSQFSRLPHASKKVCTRCIGLDLTIESLAVVVRCIVCHEDLFL